MISKRLESLVKYVDKKDKVIDIGCDHALLDIYLIRNKLLKNIIVCDINFGALNQGIKNIQKYKYTEEIDARLGNGLEVLNYKDKVDTVIISGMGTNTIKDIFSNEKINKINKCILQSNNDHYELRKFMLSIGFMIEDEEYFIDNKKNYINMVFVRGNKKYSKDEIKYGPVLIKNKDYLLFELNNTVKIYNYIPKNHLRLRFIMKREIKKLNKLINKI